MAVETLRSPFRPAPGRLPPYLAGRETEQSVFRRLLSDLEERRPPPREVILYGPRGNGKTALLAWVQEEAASRPRVDVVRVTPSRFRDRNDCARVLRPRRWWNRLVPGSPPVRSARRRARAVKPPSLHELISRRVRRKPLALLLDEAHTLDRQVGRELLNCAQQVGAELPFSLVLAGTPDLPAHLDTLGAGFWNRAEKRTIGRLDASQTAAALREPLRAEGVSVTDEALDHLVRESDGYPYFIQLWGREVWKRVRNASNRRSTVTLSEVEAAQPDFERQRDDYYADRLQELEDGRLLPAAQAVAKALRERPRLDAEGLERAVRGALPASADDEAADAARTALRHLGFIWREGGSRDWEPGIPSLMDYIAPPGDPGSS